MSLLETLKQKWASITIGATIISSVVGGTIAVETRYAKAADITSLRVEQRELNRQALREQRVGMDQLRKEQIEDKLFELRLRERPSSAERAMIERYQDQLREVNNRLDKQMQ